MKLNFLKPKKVFKKGGFHSSPDLFWHLFLAIGLVIVIAFAIFGGTLFLKVDQEPILEDSNASTRSSISSERINNALDIFFIRKQNSDHILNSPSPAIDPSL